MALEIGDILNINPTSRLVYKGANKADAEMLYPARTDTGGLDKSQPGTWKVHKANQALSDAQITFWLGKK